MSDKKETKAQPDLVKVVILSHVENWKPGDEVMIPAEKAHFMCQMRKRHDGNEAVDYRTAMTYEEFLELKKTPVDQGGLTQGEYEALGKKNVIPTPHDPAFERRLEALRRGEHLKKGDKVKKGKKSKDEDDLDEEKANERLRKASQPSFKEVRQDEPNIA